MEKKGINNCKNILHICIDKIPQLADTNPLNFVIHYSSTQKRSEN